MSRRGPLVLWALCLAAAAPTQTWASPAPTVAAPAPTPSTSAPAVPAEAPPADAAAPPREASAPPTEGAAAGADDEALPFRLSLPTRADVDAWQDRGLRVELGGRYGEVLGVGGAPDGGGFGVLVRVGARLDARWSLLGAFHYASVAGIAGQDLFGLRYLIAAEPELHLGHGVSAAIGVGLAGFVEGRSGRSEPDGAGRDALVAPRTLPAPGAPLPQCNGAGPAALLRLSYRWVLGPIAALGADLQGDLQTVACVDDTGRVEPDTATAVVRRQWWTHGGASAHLVVAWR